MRFMVTLGFAIADNERAEAMSLVAQEQAHIADLQQRGTVEAFYLSVDRAHAWLVMRGATQAAVEAELRAFPLHRFMRPSFAALA